MYTPDVYTLTVLYFTGNENIPCIDCVFQKLEILVFSPLCLYTLQRG